MQQFFDCLENDTQQNKKTREVNVKSRLLRMRTSVLLLALLASGATWLQAQDKPQAASVETAQNVATATIRGHVADQTGALIPNVAIEVDNALGVKVATTTADALGVYTISGLAPGNYIVRATVTGFAPFASPTIAVAAGQTKRVAIAMAIEVEQQNVVVTDESSTVSVEAADNASSVVIKGKDLDALSDDPDELENELTALAGPSAGPNGGQIYIDGFTGGQLPPKSAIREIRINQNPFSAEFDHLGYGRIEILTKPGTDKLHGRVFMMGNDSATNTGSPFAKNIPGYYTLMYNATLSGAINKRTSFNLSFDQRNNQNQQVYTFTPATLDAGTGNYSFSSTAANLSGSMANPHNRINFSPRIDFAVSDKNTLTVRYQYYHDSEKGDISSTELPTQSADSVTNEHSIQLSDSQVITDKLLEETRFIWRRDSSTTTPVSTNPTLSVSGDFTAGGSSSGSSSSHTDHLELQNVWTLSAGRQAIKFGTTLRDNREAVNNNANYNGSLSLTQTGFAALLNNGGDLSQLTSGTDYSHFSVSAGQQSFKKNVFDAALFFQDDWKVNRLLTLSGGIRWESQNHIYDKNDWAPRVAFAYALDGHKDSKKTKTVLRGGWGIFYDRMGIGSLLNATEQGVDSGRVAVTTSSTACITQPNTANFLSWIEGINTNSSAMSSSANLVDWSGCLPTSYKSDASSTVVEVASNFHAPYTEQGGIGIERQLTKTITATATYLHSYGLHQVVTRNANAYEPGTYQYGATTQANSRPDASLGIVSEYDSAAIFKQNQLILNVNARVSNTFNIMGFYNLSYGNTNGAGATASFASTLKPDYGRAAFVSRNMLFLMATYDTPFWKLRLNPFLIYESGKPFNIVTSNDLTGDAYMASRPSFADKSQCLADTTGQYVQTKYGCFNTIPTKDGSVYDEIPINYGNGPHMLGLNLRLSRNVGIGPKTDQSSNSQGGGPGGPGGPGGGGRGGGPGGGLGPGGLSGSRGGPPSPFSTTNRKYNLSFSVEAMNLLNIMNYGTPIGTVGSTNFGKSTTMAGGPFSSGSASRRVFFQAAFNF